MEYFFIKDLISDNISGEWGIEPVSDKRVKVIRTTNFTNKGEINLSNVVEREIPDAKVQQKRLKFGDIIIEKSGGSPSQPVGRVVFFDNADGDIYLCNNFTSILRPSAKVIPKYLFYSMHYLHKQNRTLNYQNKTTGIINLQLDRYIKSEKLPLPPIEDQKRIVEILDRADALREKRKQAIELLDDYLKSVFLNLFGDLAKNPKGWKMRRLSDIADIASGVTKGRKIDKTKTVLVPYMRVANVQDEHIDLTDVKEIEALPSEVEKYRLLNGDLLLTEGGDPDKLGRGGIWRGKLENCIHQNHIFRVRLDDTMAIPEYISAEIGSAYGKMYFLKSAKQTTGIASINMTQLKNFPVLLPDLRLQIAYSKYTVKIELLKQQMLAQSKELENQFQALMQKAFRGEL